MIPPETPEGQAFATGLAALSSAESIASAARQATSEIFAALDAIKAAPNNPYGSDDEAIAHAIFMQVELRENRQRDARRAASRL